MPRLSVWFVRASLIYLMLGLSFGGLILAEKGISYFPPVWNLLPIHIEFLLTGWLIQLAMGVAFWIVPRFGVGAPRGNESLMWIALACINAGILFTTLQFWSSLALIAGRVLETAGILIYVLGIWRRVKPIGM